MTMHQVASRVLHAVADLPTRLHGAVDRVEMHH